MKFCLSLKCIYKVKIFLQLPIFYRETDSGSDMNKHEMIEELSRRCGLNLSETQELFDATVTVLQETLIDDKGLTVPGFGTFENRTREAHRFFNLVSKEFSVSPKKVAITFHASSELKNRLYTLKGINER